MSALLWVLLFVVLSIPVAARIRKTRPNVFYMWPWDGLVRMITRLSTVFDWSLYGDVALTLVVGPLLAYKFIRHRKESLAFFFIYVSFLFLLLPAIGGGTSLIGPSLANLLVVTLLGFGGYALLLVGSSALAIVHGYLSGVRPSPGIAPALPGVSVGGFQIPLVEGIVALIVALFVHEGAHGVVSLRERIPVESGGVITVGLLPIGAYVEPKESVFRRAPVLSRVRVLSAGPVANLLVFALFALLLVASLPLADYLTRYDCSHSMGVRILDVPETLEVGGKYIKSSAHGVLQPGDVIVEINGVEVNCVNQFMDMLLPLQEEEANVSLPLLVLRGGEELNVTVTTNSGYLGIKGVENAYETPLPFWYHALSFLLSLLTWVAFLNFMIGLVNMLPLPPLDGGFIYRDVLGSLGAERLYRAVLWLTVTILVINILPWFV
ncbi:MAG: hypothetical protein PWP76_464 [Candidatus Diapherotrites archaeon]|nr:hypothetical protein [Candidatus Diapherotrites archaeon]MDN5366643.1 hypothetical protein [Candidatus Diapherotrites archaeon]